MDALKLVTALAVIGSMFAAGTTAAEPTMTKSEAKTLARAVTLKAEDLPGYEASAPTRTRGEDLWGGKRFARCSGRKALGRALADVQTSNFERVEDNRYEMIGSEVEVMPNAALVKRDIAIAKSARGRRCLVAELRAGKPADAKVLGLKVTLLRPGIKAGVALRVKFVIDSDGTRVPFYTDVLVIGRRNVEAAVFFLTSPGAMQRSTENKYLNIVETRLETALNPNAIL